MQRNTFSPVSDDSSGDEGGGGFAVPCPSGEKNSAVSPSPGLEDAPKFTTGDPVWCSKKEWNGLPPWPAKVDEGDEQGLLECHFFEVSGMDA